MTARSVQLHAESLLRRELARRRGALAQLSPERRAAIEEVSERAVAASVDELLELARSEPLFASALDSIYGTGSLSVAATRG